MPNNEPTRTRSHRNTAIGCPIRTILMKCFVLKAMHVMKASADERMSRCTGFPSGPSFVIPVSNIILLYYYYVIIN